MKIYSPLVGPEISVEEFDVIDRKVMACAFEVDILQDQPQQA